MSVLIPVGVRASDLSKSIRFWRDGLGLRVAGKRGIRYDLTDGYHNFAVFQHQGDDRPEHVSGMVDYLHIGVGVPDLAAAARRLRDMGYTIYSDGLGRQDAPRSRQSGAARLQSRRPRRHHRRRQRSHHHVAGHDDPSEPDGSAGGVALLTRSD